MSNEVEKKITKQNNFYKATLQGVPWEQGVDMVDFSFLLSKVKFIVLSNVKFV